MNELEKEQARRTAILIIAALMYTRAPGGKPSDVMKLNAELSFEFAEIFVDTAKDKGYDPATIAAMDWGSMGAL